MVATFAGTPYASAFAGISLFTKLCAPTTAFSPIVTPGITVECEPIRQLRVHYVNGFLFLGQVLRTS